MNKTAVRVESRKILADIITPVSIYLKIRDIYPNALLLESSDYHSKENSFSFICMDPVAELLVLHGICHTSLPGIGSAQTPITPEKGVVEQLNQFISSFEISSAPEDMMVDGVFGYSSYDAVQYFEDITLKSPQTEKEEIPEVRYNFFRFVLAINHFTFTTIDNVLKKGQFIGEMVYGQYKPEEIIPDLGNLFFFCLWRFKSNILKILYGIIA